MKYFRYIGLLIVIFVVGYFIIGALQKKNFEEQVQINGEKHTVEIFNRASTQYDLKFSSYQEAKKYFQEQAGTDNIYNLKMYTSLNQFNDVPVLGAIISSNHRDNRCIYGKLNLVTGEFFTKEDVCIIFN